MRLYWKYNEVYGYEGKIPIKFNVNGQTVNSVGISAVRPLPYADRPKVTASVT
jgi:hypothetical protein